MMENLRRRFRRWTQMRNDLDALERRVQQVEAMKGGSPAVRCRCMSFGERCIPHHTCEKAHHLALRCTSIVCAWNSLPPHHGGPS